MKEKDEKGKIGGMEIGSGASLDVFKMSPLYMCSSSFCVVHTSHIVSGHGANFHFTQVRTHKYVYACKSY